MDEVDNSTVVRRNVSISNNNIDDDDDDDMNNNHPHRHQQRRSRRRRLALCWSCICRTFQVAQTIIVIILGIIVVYIGLQLHTLQLQVEKDEELIAALQKQVANQHQNQQDLTQRVNEEHSLTLYQMAGTFTLLTCLLTAFHIASHLSNYNQAVIQRKIIAILWMSPVYSITSFLSLIFPTAGGYLAIIKDFYEAYTIYTFLSFLIAVLGRGNRETAIEVLAQHADHLRRPTKCLNSFYYPPPETSPTAMANAVLMECQILAMQFVLVRPVTSIISFVTESIADNNKNDATSGLDDNNNNEESPYAYFMSFNFVVAMITNISVFFAFHGLLKFYHVVREDLQWCQPFNKFLSVKAIVFLTFWQGLTIAILVNIQYSSTGGPLLGGGGSVPTMPVVVVPSAPMSLPTPTYLSTHAPALSPIAVTVPSAEQHIAATTPQPATLSPTSIEGATVDLTPAQTPAHNNSTRHHRLRHLLENSTTGASGTNSTTSSATTSNSSNEQISSSRKKEENKSSHERAFLIQNFLICLEMLFFSMAHYCVFPAEEWKPDYRPQQHYAKPGIGLKDFVKDISYIMTSSSTARRAAAYHRQQSSSDGSTLRSNDNDEIEMDVIGNGLGDSVSSPNAMSTHSTDDLTLSQHTIT